MCDNEWELIEERERERRERKKFRPERGQNTAAAAAHKIGQLIAQTQKAVHGTTSTCTVKLLARTEKAEKPDKSNHEKKKLLKIITCKA